MKEYSVRGKEKNNDSYMNDQIEDGNNKECASINDKGKKHPNEATKE